MIPALRVLNTATIKRQDINTNSPGKTYLADSQSLMELEIINKRPIPIDFVATISAKLLINNNVFDETDGAMVLTEKINMFIRTTPNNK